MTYKEFRMNMLLLGWDESIRAECHHYIKGNRNANIHKHGVFNPTMVTEDSAGETAMMALQSRQELYDLIMDIEERDDFGSYSNAS